MKNVKLNIKKNTNIISWTKPLFILSLFSFLIFLINRAADYYLIKHNIHPFAGIFSRELGNLTNSLGGLGEVVTAVLGIQITAVAIIVQLSANKYSSKIMEMFIENKVNFIVIGLFVATAINTVLVTNTLTEDFIPYFSISITLLLIVISLLIVIPHFSYVFNFLRPQNFLDYVKEDTLETLDKLSRKKIAYSNKLKERINNNVNFIGDIAVNFVYQGERAITLISIKTLREILCLYMGIKKELPDEWFDPTGLESTDPDFSNYSPFVMKSIHEKRTLLERKVFRLFEMIFNNSRSTLRDVASGVLLNSKIVALTAIENNDDNSLRNVFQYFNSYLRIAINGKDPRSAFNTMEHYRMVAERLLDTNPKLVEEISFYFKYYGQEASKNRVLFILETAAHDVCQINELAYIKKVPNIKELLELFLNLDEPINEDSKEEIAARELSLIGVRIAQVKLAGFYLLNNEAELARAIYTDMQIEPKSRIKKIKDIIFKTNDEEYWEVTSRGINFFYVSPERKEALVEFFKWFDL